MTVRGGSLLQNSGIEPDDWKEFENDKSSARSQSDACGKGCEVKAHMIQNEWLMSDKTFCCESQSHSLLGNNI